MAAFVAGCPTFSRIEWPNISTEHYCVLHGNEAYIHVFRWARHPLLPPIRQFGMPSAQRITLTTPSPWSLLPEAHPVVLVSVGSETICEVPNIVAMPKRLESQLILQFSEHGQILWPNDQGILKLLGRHIFEAMLLISMKTFQKCSTDLTTSLVAGLCRLPKLQVCELSDPKFICAWVLCFDVETSAWRKQTHFEACVYFDILEICVCVIFDSGGVGFLTYDGPATLAVGKPDRTVNHCFAGWVGRARDARLRSPFFPL